MDLLLVTAQCPRFCSVFGLCRWTTYVVPVCRRGGNSEEGLNLATYTRIMVADRQWGVGIRPSASCFKLVLPGGHFLTFVIADNRIVDWHLVSVICD